MADDVEMTPVEMTPVAAEPPKASPSVPPVKKPGATVSALKPGLKLPPKPGATVAALKPGLKLPPKPGATVSALKPGLKLPPKPGATVTALKPGLKLPPKPGATALARPVIRKPGEAAAPTALPKPVVPVDAQGVGKLPTVEAKTLPRPAEPAAAAEPIPAEAQKPLEALKSVTQKLKGITQPIPQQAVLRKTGIIADGATTEAQKEAAKHKTARISLSDAMGVAPVKDERAPMKTIRIRRPIDIPTGSATPASRPPAPAAPAAAPTTAPTAAPAAEATPPAEASANITQRKTLKIARPGAVRPSGKFALKRPATQATTVVKRTTPEAPAAEAGAPADEGAVADIPDIPSVVPPAPQAAAVDTTPAWLYSLSALVQLAACLAIGALAWFLYENTTIQYF